MKLTGFLLPAAAVALIEKECTEGTKKYSTTMVESRTVNRPAEAPANHALSPSQRRKRERGTGTGTRVAAITCR